MRISSSLKKQLIKTNKLNFEILESGDIFRIFHNHIQINLLKGNLLDGQMSNIYLRIKDNAKYLIYPLIGIKANSSYEIVDNKVIYQGKIMNTKYQVTLSIYENTWYYDCLIDKSTDFTNYDVIYSQDIGIHSEGAISSSEAYVAQYIDHSIYKGDNGFIIQSRQNQGEPCYFQMGGLNNIIHYSTDGFQIFKNSYKVDNIIKGLQNDLEDRNYQYEFPYLSLQSSAKLAEHKTLTTFYAYFTTGINEILHNPIKVEHSHKPHDTFTKINKHSIKPFKYNVLQSNDLPIDYMDTHYPNKRHMEYDKNNNLLSFFTSDKTHVVTRLKESLTERPHGHLLISGDILSGKELTFATTNFMMGIFSSHVVLGNTNIQKLSGDNRNPLNVSKISGLRVYVKLKGTYHLLTTPSLYEMGINYAKWIYAFNDDTLIVTTFVKLSSYVQRITIESKQNKKYDYLITNQLVLGDNEYQRDINTTVTNNKLTITTQDNSFVHEKYPTLKYRYSSHQDVSFSTDKVLFDEEKGHGLLTLEYKMESSITLDIQATYDKFEPVKLDLQSDKVEYESFISSLSGYKLTHPTMQDELYRLEDILFWFTHNALVHFSSPHGLEQSNGAAWGLRDVLQGPVELFMSANRYDLIKMIIIKVFRRQFIETYDFPQWFMFDKYYSIQAHESHGDIIVWPLKVLGDYLNQTNDYSILDEQIPYMSIDTNSFTDTTDSLLIHLEKTLNAIEKSFIKGINLPMYGGGDWDDTLQPANKKLTDHMASGWTPLLLFQALNTLSKCLVDYDINKRIIDLKMRVQKDYNKYFIKDKTPAGFVVFESDHQEYLLHPRDKNTGLKYRLLPLTRSIISEFVTKRQAKRHVNLINKHLKHPDGVRLMDTFVTYRGGMKTYFQRGETATNVGREIGIQYVHAHIRYIEAMAKLGNFEEAYKSLFTVNPINIDKSVHNAMLRQSNTYFSSSDAAFYDRYEAKRDFNLVKSGKIGVKGGWRLYSSGPGIYINQLIRNVIGIRLTNDSITLDPAIPKSLMGLQVEFTYNNKTIKLTYNHNKYIRECHIDSKDITNQVTKLHNPYRKSGIVIPRSLLDSTNKEIIITTK